MVVTSSTSGTAWWHQLYMPHAYIGIGVWHMPICAMHCKKSHVIPQGQPYSSSSTPLTSKAWLVGGKHLSAGKLMRKTLVW